MTRSGSPTIPYLVHCEDHASFLTLREHAFILGGIAIGQSIAKLPSTPELGVEVD